MREIVLLTTGSEFVAIVDIAPFPDGHLPDVVGWGDRVFQLKPGDQSAGELRPVYREAFAVVSFTDSPGRSMVEEENPGRTLSGFLARNPDPRIWQPLKGPPTFASWEEFDDLVTDVRRIGGRP